MSADEAEWTARLLEATELAIARLREDENPEHRELIADLERLRARLAGESATGGVRQRGVAT